MTDQTPPRTAAFTATVRVHLLHAPDPDTEPNPDLEAAATREGVVFALPPHKGDTFIPGQLSQALLGAEVDPGSRTGWLFGQAACEAFCVARVAKCCCPILCPMGYLEDAEAWAHQAKLQAETKALEDARLRVQQEAAWVPAWHDELFRVLQTHYRDVPLRQFVRKPRGFLDQFRSGENPNFDICKTVGRGWEIEYRWESPAAVDGCATSGVERLAVSSDSVWLMDAKRSQERGMARVSKRATFGDAANISSNWDPFVVPLLATIIFGAPGRAKVLLGPPRV